MKTVVLYNIISFIIIVALIFVLRIVSKSNLTYCAISNKTFKNL